MDPNTAWHDMSDTDPQVRYDAATGLHEWCARHGFLPAVAMDRSCIIATCINVASAALDAGAEA